MDVCEEGGGFEDVGSFEGCFICSLKVSLMHGDEKGSSSHIRAFTLNDEFLERTCSFKRCS